MSAPKYGGLGQGENAMRNAEEFVADYRRKGYPEVVAFMQAVPPARQLGAEEELDEDPVLKEMTLGTKRSKARLRDRDLIDRLCHDQDPIVIENLLRNPAEKRKVMEDMLKVKEALGIKAKK